MNGPRCPTSAFPLALALMLVASFADAKPSFPWPDFDDLAARYPGVGAVCLVDESEIDLDYLENGDIGKIENVRLVVAVLDPARCDEWLDRTLYDSEYHRVSRIDAKTWLAPDKSVAVPAARIFDVESAPDYVLFQDVRGKRFAFPAVAPRTVLELRYHVLAREVLAVEHGFGHTIPTEHSSVSITVPREWFGAGFNQIVRAKGVHAEPEREVLPRPNGDVVRFTWRMESVPAIPIERSMPPFADVSPRVTVIPQAPKWAHEGWHTLGQRYWEGMFAGRMSHGSTVAAMATQLAGGAASDEEKFGRIARFVQKDIRYVAIELGIGGYEPHLADEVLANRYGDCKDKVCLLLSLLAAQGIAGEAALVRTTGEGELDTALVDLGQFNHMIARVRLGDRVVWIDPTAANCAPGYVPAADQGTVALVVSPAEARLESTPVHDSEDSPLVRSIDATLGADGRLAGTLTIAALGEAALEYRSAFRKLEPAAQKTMFEELVRDRVGNARLVATSVNGLDSLDAPFRLEASFERDGAAVTVDGSMLVLPELVTPAPPLDGIFASTDRVHPIAFDCLRSWRDRIRVVPPPGWTSAAAVEPASFNGRYFMFTLDGGTEGTAGLVDRTVESRTLTVPAHAYADARAELDRIREADGAARLLFRKGP